MSERSEEEENFMLNLMQCRSLASNLLSPNPNKNFLNFSTRTIFYLFNEKEAFIEMSSRDNCNLEVGHLKDHLQLPAMILLSYQKMNFEYLHFHLETMPVVRCQLGVVEVVSEFYFLSVHANAFQLIDFPLKHMRSHHQNLRRRQKNSFQ